MRRADDFRKNFHLSVWFAVIGPPPHRLHDASEGTTWEKGTTMMDYSMDTAPTTVTQSLTLELIDPTGAVTPLEAELHYDPSDPYAVTTVFMTGASQVRWTFGRELLVEGLYEPSGDGDVH